MVTQLYVVCSTASSSAQQKNEEARQAMASGGQSEPTAHVKTVPKTDWIT